MMSAKQIYQKFNASREIRSKIAIELRNSYPVPVRDGDGFYWRAFYFASFGRPPSTMRDIYAPQWSAALDADGRLLAVRKGTPADYGLDADPDEPFGSHSYVEQGGGLGPPVERVERLLAAYDPVVSAWLAGRDPDAPGQRSVRDTFRQWFYSLAEPFFLPVYRGIGPDFFGWVDA